MEFDLSKIKLSNSDIKRNLKFPQELTTEIAELIGIILGDGNIYLKENKQYELSIYGHMTEDKDHHLKITKLIKKLFNIQTYETKNISFNCIRTRISSKGILYFITKSLKLNSGDKRKYIKIPKYILNNKEITASFLRGLFDTDFTLVFKKRGSKKRHDYPTIRGKFNNKEFVKQLNQIIKGLDFKTNMYYEPKYDKKKNKIYHGYAIELNGKYNLEKWMNLISINNLKHLTKYKIWKKYGFCPPHTNLSERQNILNKRLDPNIFYKN
ncbi:hypothetical protein CL618_01245 [archaeon]|nr:hypothetical protein [archaeon]|tara:strand:- start:2327 stop:3130 length:804 start_codon:yes stop_codon:yes gene_type:complete